MSTKRFFALSSLLFVLCTSSLYFLMLEARAFSRNGAVCNYSSRTVWLTVTESRRQKSYSLAPGNCTDASTQDVEAIWGKVCDSDPCKYQAWKVAAGHFGVYDDTSLPGGVVLRIRGWGIGSRWHITRAWPRPELSVIDYSLMR